MENCTVVEKYARVKNDLNDIYTHFAEKKFFYQRLQLIIDQLFSKSRDELIKVISRERSVGTCLLDHSVSVSMLFVELCRDLKEFVGPEKTYYEGERNMGAKVLFDEISFHRYAMGALLHDFGKAFVPKEIICKNGPLSVYEFDVIRKHPGKGRQILQELGVKDMDVLDIVGNHHYHYRVDNGIQSPLAQMCNMVDIYDACRFDRPYKGRFSYEKVKKILETEFNQNGWDTQLFTVFMNVTLVRIEKYFFQEVG